MTIRELMKLTDIPIEIGLACNGEYMASLKKVYLAEPVGFLIGVTGYAETINQAVINYCKLISGKRIKVEQSINGEGEYYNLPNITVN